MKFAELIAGKSDFNLAYIGGSITQGSGASKQELRYTSLFTTLLGERYKDVKFHEINAGVGGTCSNLGLFRMQSEILAHKPDFLFIEFSVNDCGWGDPLLTFYEELIRMARKYNPQLPIMLLYCYCSALDGTTRENPAHVVMRHHEIAQTYQLPECYMGYDVLDKINDYGGDVKSFTRDGCHPNDEGYRTYVDAMMRDIHKADFVFPALPEKKMWGVEFNDPRMIKCEEMDLPEGWILSKRTLWENPLHYICADIPGTKIEFDFEGTTCGAYMRIEKDGGKMHAVVDGEDHGDLWFWDHYALDFDRNAHVTIADALPAGKHHVELTVLPEIPSNDRGSSEGHVCRIASFLVG